MKYQEILKILHELKECYKKDLYLYINTHLVSGNSKNTTKLYKNILDKGYIVERTKLKPNNRRTKDEQIVIVGLSKYGRYTCKDLFGLNTYRDIHLNDDELQRNSNILLFKSADIVAMQSEKPSLNYLYGKLIENRDLKIEGYADNQLNMYELQEHLEHGIYYSSNEYRKFVNRDIKDLDANFRGSRFKGIYISKTSCLVVYRAKGCRLRDPYRMTNNLLESIYPIVSGLTYVFRRLNVEDVDGSAERLNHKIGCLIITDGYAYARKAVDVNNKEIKNLRNSFLKSDETIKSPRDIKFDILDCYSANYQMLFVIPDNQEGANDLKYIAGSSIEKYFENYLASDGRYNIPVFEIKTIFKMLNLGFTYDDIYSDSSFKNRYIKDIFRRER